MSRRSVPHVRVKRGRSKRKAYLPALVFALGLFAYAAYLGAPYATYVRATGMLASATVGTSAAVPENQYNLLAAQLQEKESELGIRAEELAAQEAVLNARDSARGSDIAVYSFLVSIALLVLLGVNFYLDWKRGQKPTRLPGTIDLSARG